MSTPANGSSSKNNNDQTITFVPQYDAQKNPSISPFEEVSVKSEIITPIIPQSCSMPISPASALLHGHKSTFHASNKGAENSWCGSPAPSIYSEGSETLGTVGLQRPVPLHRRLWQKYRSQERILPQHSGWSSPTLAGTPRSQSGSGDFVLLSTKKSPTPGTRTKSFFRAVRDAIFRHIDPKTVFEMFDFRELVYPFGLWKYTVLLLVGCAIAGVVVSEHYFHWIEESMEITRKNMLPILVIVIGLEPLMISIVLLVARVAKLESGSGALPSGPGTDEEDDPSILEKITDHRTALVIPCHNSDREAMKKVLKSAYPHFRPQDIFIVDNGRTKYPPDDFRDFMRQQHPDIVYIWSPIGSKNAAQLVGALAAKDYEFIMTVDDDVSIPANFRAPIDKIDNLTKGVAFPLRAIDAHGRSPLFMVAWQDCEYKMSGLSKLAESRLCGVLYPHGAGWFCERNTLIDLISNYHSLDFIAEDVNTGLSMQKMKKRIAFDSRIVLETEVPTTLIGPGLNWWQQRKNSWEMGRHGRLLAFAGRLFLSFNGQTTIQGILAQKFIHCYAIATVVVDWVRVPVLVTMGSNLAFWRQALLLSLVSILPLMAFKYISARRRPDLQPGFWGCLTYPFYKQLYALVSIIGAVRSVVHYIGGHKLPKTVRQMIKSNDERAFWTDPRFESNPGFLADEGEMLQGGWSGATSSQVTVVTVLVK
ncbi:uncharacterized protein BP5553_09050 [Venustampulla echinocandica]|uniref:Glycosyltransferase 2-like domain-containing protein n=1 Tax=Venustampulla echinocandica TaxID=2656787 RepID=A0A370TDR5_9HELO|nr:uncharacterized protein BP5553_09050 [Venustampulla echinocandica]RDL32594.1 hypothetical protein BP5553_09050 [Venustampulla echinocandica]